MFILETNSYHSFRLSDDDKFCCPGSDCRLTGICAQKGTTHLNKRFVLVFHLEIIYTWKMHCTWYFLYVYYKQKTDTIARSVFFLDVSSPVTLRAKKRKISHYTEVYKANYLPRQLAHIYLSCKCYQYNELFFSYSNYQCPIDCLKIKNYGVFQAGE